MYVTLVDSSSAPMALSWEEVQAFMEQPLWKYQALGSARSYHAAWDRWPWLMERRGPLEPFPLGPNEREQRSDETTRRTTGIERMMISTDTC